jgi:hypothetical protein
MKTYFVECYWPGVSMTQVDSVLGRLDGHGVRWLAAILVPVDEIVLCVVEGPSALGICDAADSAGLPSERVVECVHCLPPSSSTTALVAISATGGRE